MPQKRNKRRMIKTWILKLQEKWQVESLFQVFVILVVFSLAGSTIAATKDYYFGFLGFDEHTNAFVKIVVALLVYQVVLLFYGTLLGQFRFFWNKEKKMFQGLVKLVRFVIRLPLKLIPGTSQDK